ncbi:unnamed protein product [Closterium sp. Naga37s-1]|nr:unnamed protein product [Closterium sp. Naga37s-1]
MKRAPLFVLLLGAAFFTAAAAAASIPSFILHDGDVSAAQSGAQAKPSVFKGKIIKKYVAKLRPPRINGKRTGDKGASGKYVKLAVRFSASSNNVRTYITISNLKNGGTDPGFNTGAFLCSY